MTDCFFEGGSCLAHRGKIPGTQEERQGRARLCELEIVRWMPPLEKPPMAGPPPDNQHLYLHPRHEIVARADLAIGGAIIDQVKLHKITYAELIGILLRQTADWNKYAIRQERHPNDPSKKGDEW